MGDEGGHTLVISPPELEFYFFKVSELLDKGEVSYKQNQVLENNMVRFSYTIQNTGNSQNLKKLN